MAQLKQCRGIYAITAPEYFSLDHAYSQACTLLQSGISILQFRDKINDFGTCLAIGKKLKEACQKHNALFIVNDSVELALQLAADGVHLGQSDDGYRQARAKLGPDAIIGITCHDQLPLAITAQNQGANYVAFGRAFASTSKPGGPSIEPAIIAQYQQQLNIPVVAIGGIDENNIAAFGRSQIPLLAVINALYQNDSLSENCHRLIQAYKNASVFPSSTSTQAKPVGVMS